MTNKEAAAYFASLDPEKEASIYFANGDAGTIEDCSLDAAEDLNDLERFERIDFKEFEPKKPTIYQKW